MAVPSRRHACQPVSRSSPATAPAGPAAASGFNFKQFRSNVVFRWEYRPGFALFVVWSQGRQRSTGIEGTRSFGGDMNELFNLRPDNRFLVKLSYWFNR